MLALLLPDPANRSRTRSSPAWRLLAGGGEEFGGLGPVHDRPPGGDVVGSLVAVFEVVGVLPDIQAQDGCARAARDGLAHERVVLVGGGGDRELAVLGDEPGPARSEARGRGGGELLLEPAGLVETAEGGPDGVGERTR